MNLSLSVCLKWIEDSFDWYNRSIDRALRQRDLVKAQNALAAREACERIATEFRDNFARYERLASTERNGRPSFKERTRKGSRRRAAWPEAPGLEDEAETEEQIQMLRPRVPVGRRNGPGARRRLGPR